MPTYKHPCPWCGKFIDKVVAACPYCGHADPFAPKRCPACSKIVEDPAWVVCPSCGGSLTIVVAPGGAAAAGSSAPAPAPSAAAAPPAASAAPTVQAPQALAGKCSGCGAPLPAGARFCTVCGTVAG
jgi:rRNA maturation endonuclease Nob1